MVALPIITGVTRVAFRWRQGVGGPTAVNVMHFQQTTPAYATLLSALQANVTQAMWPQCWSTAGIYQLDMTMLDGASATQSYLVSGSQWGGVAGSGDYVPQVAGIVSLKTGLRGRKNRGRVFLPFCAENMISNGAFSTGLTGAQTAWNTFVSNMATANAALCIASYGYSLHKHKNPDGSITMTPVTWAPVAHNVLTATIESNLGTLRRRQSRLR